MNKKIKEIIPYFIVILIVVLLRIFIISPITVTGSSMVPNFYEGDYLFLDKMTYYFKSIERFDIVVVQRGSERLIKRVIGLPGEVIEYKGNVLYVNDVEIVEPFKHYDTEDFSLSNLDYEVIPDDYYLVIGDNRPVSLDSRIFGLIKRDDIIGKAGLVVLPINHFGIKE